MEQEIKFERHPVPDTEVIDTIKNMPVHDRLVMKAEMLSEISDREYLVHMVNQINDEEGVSQELTV